MRFHAAVRLLPTLVLAFVLPTSGLAAGVDGKLDLFDGPPLVTQANGYPGMQDRHDTVPYRDHTALDVLHASVPGDGMLHVLVAGVLEDWIAGYEAASQYDNLFLFVDDQPGGQHTLIADATPFSSFAGQAGLSFDAGFTPDFCLQMRAPALFGGGPSTFYVQGYRVTLGDQATNVEYLGTSNGAAPGLLAGGTNPTDIRLAIDNSDTTGGVPMNCAPGSGAGVTTGVEWAIPLPAIGNPPGCFRIMVYAAHNYGLLENQVLPPVPTGTCMLGAPASVDFSAIAGEQFVTVCPEGVPVRTATWGSLKTRYR
jgi:hypothetical protein